jgi:hypothetical protein
MNIEAKTVDDSRVETVHLVMSGHLNGAGRLFSGILMQWIFSPSQIHIEDKYDYMPDQYDPTYADLMELRDYFEEEYSGKRIIRAEVKHTDMWGFSLEVFDEERADNAAAANGLPERIVFHLANDVQLKLICDDLEYCYIIIEKVNPLNQKSPPLP